MKIGLISDTHGFIDERIIHHLNGCDEIWHAGDVGQGDVLDQLESITTVKTVFGNIDGVDIRKRTKEFLHFDIQGISFLMIHIAGPFQKYSPQCRELIQNLKPDALICGHSHILKVKRDKRFKLTYINPGAAGRHGFHHVRTLCRFEVNQGTLENFEVIELGPRSAKSVD